KAGKAAKRRATKAFREALISRYRRLKMAGGAVFYALPYPSGLSQPKGSSSSLNPSRTDCSARGGRQCIPGRERVHVVSPVRDPPVFDRDDRAEPIVVLHARREDCPTDLVFNDEDMTVVCLMDNQ